MGEAGQQCISAGRVLVVGAGALGSVCALYLAGAGVGNITVADFDTVDISNLHRQVAYTEADAGHSKARTLCSRLRALNSEITATPVVAMVTARTLPALLENVDVVADCTDNAASKHTLSRLVCDAGLPCVTAGVDAYTAQVTVTAPGHPSFADIFGDVAPGAACAAGGSSLAEMLPCAAAGVFGPAAGMAATAQAAEILKILTGVGTPLIARLLVIDTLTASANVLSL